MLLFLDSRKVRPFTIPRFLVSTTQTHLAPLTHAELSGSRPRFTPERFATLRTTVAASYDEKNKMEEPKP
jgi:hypothetical protein